MSNLFNSSEKRLAQLLLLLANFRKEGRPEPIVGTFGQETLAEMIGTTRSRVSFFMNKFRKLGFIQYNGKIEVHNSLLNVILFDKPEIRTRGAGNSLSVIRMIMLEFSGTLVPLIGPSKSLASADQRRCNFAAEEERYAVIRGRVTSMKRKLLKHGWQLTTGMSLVMIFGYALARAQEGQPTRTDATGKPPYNIVFVISDQRTYRLFAGVHYSLPALDTIARHGVTFTNHYIASAMCSPSRASFLTGQTPQVHHVFDQMEYSYTPSLSPDLPNVGSVLKGLGYKTAYFGKFEMDQKLLEPKPTVNYSTSAQPYGFDVFSAGGDIGSQPQSGFDNDPFIAGESVRWLRANARQGEKPFFMVTSFVNAHDIMYGDANVRGQPAVEKAVSPKALPPLPASSLYEKKWSFTLPPSLEEPLTAPGVPRALLEYKKGWDGWTGSIPTDRKDMWSIFYNYYLNSIRDEDRALQQIVDVLNEMDLWRDTVVVFTADHGEMGGAHGGLKGKGPFSYEANSHVPLIIAHPAGKEGAASSALTSHLDLLPTFVGLTGLPEASRPDSVKALPGHDFSALLVEPEKASVHAVRPGVLFNYVGVQTVDADYCRALNAAPYLGQPSPPVTQAKLDKRGFLSFVFDGRYKFGRYFAPTAFNTPQTLEEIFKNNDVQLFDLETDPDEVRNLAVEPEQNRAMILQMNSLLNGLIAKEVGVNDGSFLTPYIQAK